jgi:hypothetical protein
VIAQSCVSAAARRKSAWVSAVGDFSTTNANFPGLTTGPQAKEEQI